MSDKPTVAKSPPAKNGQSAARPRENPPGAAPPDDLLQIAMAQALQAQAVRSQREVSRDAHVQHLRAGHGPGAAPAGARRHGRMTAEEIHRVVACVSCGLSLRQTACIVGRHAGTLSRRIQRDEDFAAKIEWARAIAQAEPLAQIARAAKTSWRAAAWLVEYLDRKREVGSGGVTQP